MPTFEVEIKIDNFIYQVEADTEEEAKEKALEQMVEDIIGSPTSMASEFFIKEVMKNDKR